MVVVGTVRIVSDSQRPTTRSAFIPDPLQKQTRSSVRNRVFSRALCYSMYSM